MGAMKVSVTPALRSVLQEAAGDPTLPQALRCAASNWVEADAAPWGVVRDVCSGIRAARGCGSAAGAPDSVAPSAGTAGGPWLHELCAGGGLVLARPQERARTKSKELVAHLERLRRKLEQDCYDRMVHDVTAAEREAQAKAEGGLAGYKQQMSFGLHIVVMMGTFYALGHVAGLYLSSNRVLPLALGLICMVGALILESVLFIIRTTFPPQLEPRSGGSGAQKQQPQQGQQSQQGQQQRGVESSAGPQAAPGGGVGQQEGGLQGQRRQAGGTGAAAAAKAAQPKPAAAKKED